MPRPHVPAPTDHTEPKSAPVRCARAFRALGTLPAGLSCLQSCLRASYLRESGTRCLPRDRASQRFRMRDTPPVKPAPVIAGNLPADRINGSGPMSRRPSMTAPAWDIRNAISPRQPARTPRKPTLATAPPGGHAAQPRSPMTTHIIAPPAPRTLAARTPAPAPKALALPAPAVAPTAPGRTPATPAPTPIVATGKRLVTRVGTLVGYLRQLLLSPIIRMCKPSPPIRLP